MSNTADQEPTGEVDSVLNMVKKEFTDFKEKIKGDDPAMMAFVNISKSKVLQDARMFNNAAEVMKDPKKCVNLLEQLLYLVTVKGEELTPTEASDVFFGVTKLFQCDNKSLRRMVYQFIKEIVDATSAEEVIIVVSCLTKDMNSEEDLYRGNSIRVLAKVLVEPGYISQINRYIQQAVVHKNSLVSSSAILAGLQFMERVPDVVRRWVGETQEALNSQYDMVQYHSLLLLYEIRKNDIVGLTKIVNQLIRNEPHSPLAMCVLIRFAKIVILGDSQTSVKQDFVNFLDRCLHHRVEMVVFESARALCEISNEIEIDITGPIQALQMFLSHLKSGYRFAAVRTLADLAIKKPIQVSKCNSELESLIRDPNKNIGTLAITALLKTGNESSVERLVEQIESFSSGMGDEMKIPIVEAVHALSIKYPNKYQVLLSYLSNSLRDPGGYEYKRCIVNAMMDIMKSIPEAKENCLSAFCEFIEDCEFTKLGTEILHVIGEEGTKSKFAYNYIRYIYNRLILENPTIRASAVSTLGKFATKIPSLRPSILELLKRSSLDSNEEVRDRATFYVELIEKESPNMNLITEACINNVDELRRSLEMYKARPSDGPVSFSSLPRPPAISPSSINVSSGGGISGSSGISVGSISSGLDKKPKGRVTLKGKDKRQEEEDKVTRLYKIAEFKSFGPVITSSSVSELTESETEWYVTVIKYIFKEHIVFEFTIKNTLEDEALDHVTINMEVSEGDEDYEIVCVKASGIIKNDKPGMCYVAMKYNEGENGPYPNTIFTNEMKMKIKGVDATTGDVDEDGEEDSYEIDDVSVSPADFIIPIEISEYKSKWDSISNEKIDQFALSQKTVQEAVSSLISILNMKACNNTGNIKPGSNLHQLLLAGETINKQLILARCQISLTVEHGCVLKIFVRSDEEELCDMILGCIE